MHKSLIFLMAALLISLGFNLSSIKTKTPLNTLSTSNTNNQVSTDKIEAMSVGLNPIDSKGNLDYSNSQVEIETQSEPKDVDSAEIYYGHQVFKFSKDRIMVSKNCPLTNDYYCTDITLDNSIKNILNTNGEITLDILIKNKKGEIVIESIGNFTDPFRPNLTLIPNFNPTSIIVYANPEPKRCVLTNNEKEIDITPGKDLYLESIRKTFKETSVLAKCFYINNEIRVSQEVLIN